MKSTKLVLLIPAMAAVMLVGSLSTGYTKDKDKDKNKDSGTYNVPDSGSTLFLMSMGIITLGGLGLLKMREA